jgi:hypothetical protein
MAGNRTDDASGKTFVEEYSWKKIDQLEAATSSFRQTCLEMKKMCATAVVAVPTLLVNFTDKHLDASIFVSCLIIILIFWSCDAHAYYYQEKLRAIMVGIAEEIRKIREPELPGGAPSIRAGVIDVDRRKSETRLLRSFFNASQSFYLALLVLAVILSLLFYLGVFHPIAPTTPPRP